MRPSRRALGLRGRILGAVLFTAVATLAVAALTLLGPLEQSLRNAELNTLRGEVGSTKHTNPTSFERTVKAFAQQDPGLVAEADVPIDQPSTGGASIKPDERRDESSPCADYDTAYKQDVCLHKQGVTTSEAIIKQEHTLQAATGATEVGLLGYAEPSGRGAKLIEVTTPSDIARLDPSEDDVVKAFRSKGAIYSIGTIAGTQYARAALPFTTSVVPGGVGERWVLVVRKPLDTVNAAVATVRKAFLYAALAGLGLTLILGIPLSGTIVRRLRRLRHAALQLAAEGPPVEVPAERGRDEVGDLARAFAQMQQQLQHQEEARRAFVSTASHELRTPLASLDGMLELLDDDLRAGEPDIDDARLLLERARSQSRRLARLAADLLDLSRLDAQVQLRSEPVELGELSRAVLAEFDLGTGERGIVSTLDDSAGQVWAHGDPGSIARIVRILLDNAVRVSPQGGEITVELRAGENVSLTVHDEGPGVPPEERELIFQRFQRGRSASGSAGFGLGLAIGRELAERMGGELVLERTEVPGATFTLRLPVARAQEEEPLAVA
ncbi:MAG TPA: HAMP domain-containing sensor histidine kinase [Solirubrobacteraceae bacterium]|nr:HAMP domain-containing sensor histidine kinase [Solirubrobacteraceae bacterium]